MRIFFKNYKSNFFFVSQVFGFLMKCLFYFPFLYINFFLLISFTLISFFLKIIFSFDWFFFILILFLIIVYFLIRKIIFFNVFLYFPKKEKNKLFGLSYLIFFLLIISVSTYIACDLFNVLVPPMYDGQANSYFGKLISLNQFNKFPAALGFYQPGGSILTALLGSIIKNFALATNILTLISLACVPISFCLLINLLSDFKDYKSKQLSKYFLILSFLLFNFLGNWFQFMFFVGSKNSLIISSNFFFLSLYFLALFDNYKKKYYLFFSLILGSAASLIHYTSCFLYFFIFVFYLIKNRKILRINPERTNSIFAFITFFIIIAFFLYFFPSLLQFKQFFLIERFNLNPYFFLKNLFLATISYFKNPADIFIILGLFFLIQDLLKRKICSIGIFLLLFLFAFIFSYYFPANVIRIFVFEYNFYLLPIFLSVLSLKKILEMKNKRYLLIFTISFLIFFSFVNFIFFTIPNVIKTKQSVLVSKEDLEAFNWIKRNLNKEYLFFPLQIKIYEKEPIEKRIFELNALAYLKVFTDFESCPTSIDSERSNNCTHFFYFLINNSNNKKIFINKNLVFFKYYKIKYFYYSDHQHFNDEFSFLNQILNFDKTKEIYSKNGIRIFELDYLNNIN